MTATPATVIQIAESVVAEINAGDFSKTNLAAQRLYVPNFDLEDMKELRVTVVPREVEYLPLDRVSNKYHATIDVAVQKKFSKGDAKEHFWARCDGFLAVSDEGEGPSSHFFQKAKFAPPFTHGRSQEWVNHLGKTNKNLLTKLPK